MTSLIDVIFLLLLFFMLSSTFSRFAEVEIHIGSGAGGGDASTERIMFVRLTESGITLNSAPMTTEALSERLKTENSAKLLISVTANATAQALTDVLVVARAFPGLDITVLEAS